MQLLLNLFINLCMYFCFQVTQWTRLQHICKHAEDWFPWISEFDNWNGFAYRYESTFFSTKSHKNNGSTKQQWIKVRILRYLGSLVKSLFFKPCECKMPKKCFGFLFAFFSKAWPKWFCDWVQIPNLDFFKTFYFTHLTSTKLNTFLRRFSTCR